MDGAVSIIRHQYAAERPIKVAPEPRERRATRIRARGVSG
jgi:hypothetical protein